MLREVFQGVIGVLKVEERPVLSGKLPRRGNIFDGPSNETEVLHMADILEGLREQNPSTREVTI